MDTIWKLFITAWVALIAVSCGAGFASAWRPVSYSTSYTYNTTTNWEFNILSGNTDTFAAVGICVVLIMIVRTLGRGGGK